jgi:hypothetical protein
MAGHSRTEDTLFRRMVKNYAASDNTKWNFRWRESAYGLRLERISIRLLRKRND